MKISRAAWVSHYGRASAHAAGAFVPVAGVPVVQVLPPQGLSTGEKWMISLSVCTLSLTAFALYRRHFLLPEAA